LRGDRLIGRVDPRFDRDAGVFLLAAVHAEPGAGASDGAAAWRAVRELAGWLGATDIEVRGQVPRPWRRAFAH